MTNYGRSTYVSWVDGTVLELIDFGGLSATADSLETTRYGTSHREFVPGMIDYGSVTLTMASDTINDVIRLRRSFTDRTVSALNIVTPIGFQYTFLGFITSFTHTFDKNGLYTIQATVKLSGKPTVKTYTEATIIPASGTSLVRGGSYGLFLSSTTGGQTGGEGARWILESPQTHMPNTRIIGNTLMIDAAEVNAITVTAQWYTEEGGVSESRTATYNVKKPVPTNVTIADFKQSLSIASDASNDITENVSASVYPKGAEQSVTWKIYEQGGDSAEVANTVILVDGSVLTIKKGEGGYKAKYPTVNKTTQFTLKAFSTADNNVADIQTFSVKLTGN